MRFAKFCAPLLLLVAHVVQAAPYLPVSGAEIIERLPSRADPVRQELTRLRAALAARPEDLAPAIELARRCIEIARSDGDPRYLGYAQAALSRWWKQPRPPASVRLLRATILQSTHRFDEALADLDEVLKADRGNAQAWLTRATILTVQGQYGAAESSCGRLYVLAPRIVAMTCLTNITSLKEKGRTGYAPLEAMLENSAGMDSEIKAWVVITLAEAAVRHGDHEAAERYFQQAMKLANEPDAYLLGAYSDFLLDRGRAGEVIALLKNRIRIDGLLLRYALALRAQGSPAAGEHIAALRSRFDAAMLRNDPVHQREQARFELGLMNNPKAALVLAEKNWQVQKEPADARVLLEAAQAAHDRSAASTVVDWIRKNGIEETTLARLAAGMGAQ